MDRHLAAAASAHGCGANVPCGMLLALLSIGAFTVWFLWCSLVRVHVRMGLHCVTLCSRSTTRFATANARRVRWTPDILRT